MPSRGLSQQKNLCRVSLVLGTRLWQNNRGAHLHRSTSSYSGSGLQRESVSAVKDSEVPSAVDAGFATAGASTALGKMPWQSPG